MWAFVGKAFALYIVVKILLVIWRLLRLHFLPKLGLKVNVKSYGEWAVVTGATDGIGKAYAIELARLGLKVVLFGRSQDKLDKVASEIKETFGTETKTVCYDFGKTDGYGKIEKALSGLQIGTLVNNVGMSGEHPEYFDQVSADFAEKIVFVNALSAVKMTHMVIKGMLERKKGIVIMISSICSERPIPFVSIYSATKAFVDYLGRALQTEYRSKGIIVQSLCPYYVSTKMVGIRPRMFVPDPTAFVKSALGTIGNADRCNGYFSHEVQSLLYKLPPKILSDMKIYSYMMNNRAKALQKKGKKD